MKAVFYTHGGSGNHGCEALARTGIVLIRETFDILPITLISYRPYEDKKYIDDSELRIISYPHYDKKSPFRIAYSLLNRFHFKRQEWYYSLTNSVLKRETDADTLAISIGGDNYCYGAPYSIYSANHILRDKKSKTVLLGVSIDEEHITAEMINDLKGYDLVHARESITYDTLKAKGLTNVVLYPDPAFLLETTPYSDDFLDSSEVIGINFSPLVIKKAATGLMENNFRDTIQWILENTNAKIAFIPHVEWTGNDDYAAMKALSEEFAPTGRAKLYPCCDCQTQKGIISRCSFLIAARTHVSIAAYSNYVPTLVVGYSVKAKGIATDIFNAYEDYVIDSDSMNTADALLNKFKTLYMNKETIAEYLQTFIPAYKKRLAGLKNVLQGIVL